MIKVTFEFDTVAQAAAFMQDFDSPMNEQTTAPGAADSPKRGRGRPPKVAAPVDPTPKAETVVSPVAPSPVLTPAPAPAPSVAAVPFAALVDPLTKLADIDLDKAMAILAKYGVKKASELKADQFGTVLAEVNAALAVPTKQSLL